MDTVVGSHDEDKYSYLVNSIQCIHFQMKSRSSTHTPVVPQSKDLLLSNTVRTDFINRIYTKPYIDIIVHTLYARTYYRTLRT